MPVRKRGGAVIGKIGRVGHFNDPNAESMCP